MSNFDISTPSPLFNVVTWWKCPRSVLQQWKGGEGDWLSTKKNDAFWNYRRTPIESVCFAQMYQHFCPWLWVVRVKCLAQEHNTMSPARARTRNARSGDERTNHEATAPPTAAPSGCQLYCLNCTQWFVLITAYFCTSQKLGGAAERLIDGNEKCICQLSFELLSPHVLLNEWTNKFCIWCVCSVITCIYHYATIITTGCLLFLLLPQ